MIVRQGKEEDVPHLKRMIKALAKDEQIDPPTLCVGMFIVALEGEDIIGMLMIEPAINGAVLISDMYVDAAYRRRGVGRRLVKRAVHAVASSDKSLRIGLSVMPGNAAAMQLYLGLGFRRVGTCERGYHVLERLAFDL